MNAPVTEVAVGLPLIDVNVWLVPVTVVAAIEPMEALLAPASVKVSVPPVQAAGIDVRTIVVTTLAVDVQDMPMPLSEPQELTDAVDAAIFCGFGVTGPARATSACATARAVRPTTATRRHISDQPVMVTDTPVTAAAETLLDVKSGLALPEASSVPVISASEAFEAPVSVTL